MASSYAFLSVFINDSVGFIVLPLPLLINPPFQKLWRADPDLHGITNISVRRSIDSSETTEVFKVFKQSELNSFTWALKTQKFWQYLDKISLKIIKNPQLQIHFRIFKLLLQDSEIKMLYNCRYLSIKCSDCLIV